MGFNPFERLRAEQRSLIMQIPSHIFLSLLWNRLAVSKHGRFQLLFGSESVRISNFDAATSLRGLIPILCNSMQFDSKQFQFFVIPTIL